MFVIAIASAALGARDARRVAPPLRTRGSRSFRGRTPAASRRRPRGPPLTRRPASRSRSAPLPVALAPTPAPSGPSPSPWSPLESAPSAHAPRTPPATTHEREPAPAATPTPTLAPAGGSDAAARHSAPRAEARPSAPRDGQRDSRRAARAGVGGHCEGDRVRAPGDRERSDEYGGVAHARRSLRILRKAVDRSLRLPKLRDPGARRSRGRVSRAPRPVVSFRASPFGGLRRELSAQECARDLREGLGRLLGRRVAAVEHLEARARQLTGEPAAVLDGDRPIAAPPRHERRRVHARECSRRARACRAWRASSRTQPRAPRAC